MVGIGLILSLLSQLRDLAFVHAPTLVDGTVAVLSDPLSTFHHPALAALIIVELIASIGLAGLTSVALVAFFRTRWWFPRLYIALIAFGTIFAVGDMLFLRSIAPGISAPDEEVAWEIVRSAVAALIWVPYMLRSRRVRNTFVRPANPPLPEPPAAPMPTPAAPAPHAPRPPH